LFKRWHVFFDRVVPAELPDQRTALDQSLSLTAAGWQVEMFGRNPRKRLNDLHQLLQTTQIVGPRLAGKQRGPGCDRHFADIDIAS
jgi:hypothetical protein